MTGKTHAAIGANSIWVLKLTSLTYTPLLIGVAALAALLPDLDASESMIKHLEIDLGTRRQHFRVKPFYLVALVMSHLFRHRGWLHSGVAIIIVAVASWFGLRQFGLAYPLMITIGYASHLLADALTISGIHFFLPAKNELHLLPKPLRIRTGSWVDTTLLIAAGVGIFFAVQSFAG